MKKSSFGAPKPLPGQPGYKMSISDALEKENKEMEENLKILKERMEQQEASDAKSTNGARWKSARESGSIRAYAKDVQEKNKKKTLAKPDPTTRATAAARRSVRETKASADFSEKLVDNWSIGDVGDWLQSMMLSQYISIFSANQITGPVLLDISLEDLDYMEIKALGHRKVILKGIEDLRQNKKVTKQLFAATEQNLESASQSKSHSETRHEPAVTKVHWSHLEPLATNPVTGGDAADPNSIDEEAERRAFQQAVMEWRRGGVTTEKGIKTLSIRSTTTTTTATERDLNDFQQEEEDNGMWNNPFAGNAPSNDDILDEEAERRAFQAAVMEWRRGGAAAEGNGNGNGNGDDNLNLKLSGGYGGEEDQESHVISSARSERNIRSAGRSLAEGTLDEEKEQAEFRAAVEAWRTGKPHPSLSVQTTAQRLAAELDREHQTAANRYTEYQQMMKQKIDQATRELEETKQRIQETSPLEEEEEEEGEEERDGDGDNDNDNDLDDNLSLCSSMDDMEPHDRDPQGQSHVEVSLLESHLNVGGSRSDVGGVGAVEYCVVEPPSDDEQDDEQDCCGRDDGEESKYGHIDVIEIHSSN